MNTNQLSNQGFFTLATGKDEYYELAYNLLLSYRKSTKNPMQFAIMCDRENEYTKFFDKVVIIDNPTNSYLDKISMLKNPPFEKSIFIDSDILIYDDINILFSYFNIKSGLSCPGRALDVNSSSGWFLKEDIGEYKDKISFIPTMHSALIFIVNDETTKSMYNKALEIIDNYSSFKFTYFEKPADEPVLALCMSIFNIKPIEVPKNTFVFKVVGKIKADIRKGILEVDKDNYHEKNIKIWHFGHASTK